MCSSNSKAFSLNYSLARIPGPLPAHYSLDGVLPPNLNIKIVFHGNYPLIKGTYLSFEKKLKKTDDPCRTSKNPYFIHLREGREGENTFNYFFSEML